MTGPKPSRSGTQKPEKLEHIDLPKRNRERILIRLVTAIARACIMHGTRSLTHIGLSLSQVTVLGELFGQNGCSQEELRASVSLDKGNVTRALQRLEEMGLVKREQDSTDRRVIRVYTTTKALAIETQMYALATRWDDRLTAGFTPDERETLINLLLRMEVNARAMAREDFD